MHLFRDVMDKEIVDRDGFKVGKVDDILFDLSSGDRPVVHAVLTGHDALVRLLGLRMDRLVSWLAHRVLGLPDDLKPIELDWERITAIDVVVHMDVERDDAGAMRSESFIWKHWVSRLPFARR